MILHTLVCDLCDEKLISVPEESTVAEIRAGAKAEGWRRDKLNRDVCPAHPKLRES